MRGDTPHLTLPPLPAVEVSRPEWSLTSDQWRVKPLSASPAGFSFLLDAHIYDLRALNSDLWFPMEN